MWASAQADKLLLLVHLCTSGFAGSREKAADCLDVKNAFAVLMFVPQCPESRGSVGTVLPQDCLSEAVLKLLLPCGGDF